MTSARTSAGSRALFWARFQLVRHFRKPATWAWVLGPLVVAGVIRAAGGSTTVIADLVLLYAVPLAGLSYGTSVMREEIEDQTLTYVYSRPIDRAWIYAARVAAAIIVVALVGVMGSLLSATSIANGIRTVSAAAASAAAYTALFALCGAGLKRPAAFGLVFALAWETALGSVPGFLSQLTLRAHLRNLADLRPTQPLLAQLWHPPSLWVSVLVLALVPIVATVGGALLARHREFVLTR